MLSKELENLLSNDKLGVFTLLSKYQPEIFKKDVNELSGKGLTFFNSFAQDSSEFESTKGLLELCENFGYDLKKEYSEFSNFSKKDNNKTQISNKKNPKFIPEVMILLDNFSMSLSSDKIMSYIINKLGKEYILKLEHEGWPILELAYDKKLLSTITTLTDMGLSYVNPPSEKSILSIAERNPVVLDLYWKMVNNKNNIISKYMSESQFEHFYKKIQTELRYISSNKHYRAKNMANFIVEKKDFLSLEQKNSLLNLSFVSKDLRPYKALLKIMNLKQKSEEVRDIILKNLDKVKNHELIYLLLEDDKYMFKLVNKKLVEVFKKDGSSSIKHIKEKDTYGIDKIINALVRLGIQPFDKYSKNPEASINRGFKSRLEKIFNSSETFTLFKKFENGLTFFEKLAEMKIGINEFISILDISPIAKKGSENGYKNLFTTITDSDWQNINNGQQEINSVQKAEIKEILNKTWLAKNCFGLNVLESLDVNARLIDESSLWLFNPRFIFDKSQDEIYTKEQKEFLFYYFINKYSSNAFEKHIFTNISKWHDFDIDLYVNNKDSRKNWINTIKGLYKSFLSDKNTDWENIFNGLNVLTKENIKDTEFMLNLMQEF